MDRTIRIGDKTVNRLGYGAMRITGDGIWGEPKDHGTAVAVLRRAVELGVNFIDTADAYGPEVSENLIREALYPYAEDLVIATKGGMTRSGPNQWFADGRPEHIREAVEGSLQRLGLKQIELYQFHRPDPRVPFEDSVKTFFELQREGKVKHVGLSNVSAALLKQAMQMGEIVSVQNRYSVLDRESEAVLELCQQQGIAFLPWHPIGGGLDDFGQQVLQAVADKHSATARQIGIAWLLQHSPVMVPIPGTGSLEHLEENMKAAEITLDTEDIQQLDALAA
jgi:aryl-alcohol dehydrogenase-like predicted oxidoreductase